VRACAELRPDVVLMDVHMPRLNGLEATKEIMIRTPIPIVVISAGLDREGVSIALEALRAGAVTVVSKPPGPSDPSFERACKDLTDTLRDMAQVKVVRHWKSVPGAGGGSARQEWDGNKRMVGLAASTGGPAVLREIVGHLPPDLGVPVLEQGGRVVQSAERRFVEPIDSRLPDDVEPVRKLKFSAAIAPIRQRLAALGRSHVLICGIETHVCVQQTVLDLLAEGFSVYVAADAVGSRFRIDYETALRRMDSAGATLTTTEAALFEWCDEAGTPEFKEISKLVQEKAPEDA